MITVSILINGKAIFTRSAHRRTKKHEWFDKVEEKTKQAYLLDTGEVIYHSPEDGAVDLAVQMLRTIKEV